jgi:sulfopyruvate decarboxylase subunit alpha
LNWHKAIDPALVPKYLCRRVGTPMTFEWPDTTLPNLIAERADTISGRAIIAAIKASGVEYVVSVPDITTSESLLRPLATDRDLRLVRICKEDEGVGICAGLSFCDKRALLLIQNTGLLDSINAIRAVAVEYSLPICMMVGMLAKEVDRPPAASANFGVRIVEPILDVMGIEHHLLETVTDVAFIKSAIDKAYAASAPVALLLGRPPSTR